MTACGPAEIERLLQATRMGRQIAVSLSEEDEKAFIAFLRSAADIQLLESFASTQDGLFVDHFAPKSDGHWSYDIWNRRFAWDPVFAQTRLDLPEPERRGRWYIGNKGAAPLLQYTRAGGGGGREAGRVYWAKYFTAPEGLDYDVAGFEVWYESVVRWLRKRKRSHTI